MDSNSSKSSTVFTTVLVVGAVCGARQIESGEMHVVDSISPKYMDSTTVSNTDAGLSVDRRAAAGMPGEFVPKTSRGRRIMELRRLAAAAGEEFFPADQLLSELAARRA
jgi:hypothetical protein